MEYFWHFGKQSEYMNYQKLFSIKHVYIVMKALHTSNLCNHTHVGKGRRTIIGYSHASHFYRSKNSRKTSLSLSRPWLRYEVYSHLIKSKTHWWTIWASSHLMVDHDGSCGGSEALWWNGGTTGSVCGCLEM